MEGRLDCPETFWGGVSHLSWILIATLRKTGISLWSPLSYLLLLTTLQAAFAPTSLLTPDLLGFSQLSSCLTTVWPSNDSNDLRCKLKNQFYIQGSTKGKLAFTVVCDVKWDQKSMCDLGLPIP